MPFAVKSEKGGSWGVYHVIQLAVHAQGIQGNRCVSVKWNGVSDLEKAIATETTRVCHGVVFPVRLNQ